MMPKISYETRGAGEVLVYGDKEVLKRELKAAIDWLEDNVMSKERGEITIRIGIYTSL